MPLYFNVQSVSTGITKLDQQLLADHVKYKDPDYSDREVEGLMRYFQVSAYKELLQLFKVLHVRK